MSSLEELVRRLDGIEDTVKENRRALRGANGNTGLVADMRLVRQDQVTIREFFENDLKHLQELLKLRDERTVKWPQLLWRFGAPIAIALAASGLTTWLLSNN